LFTLPTLCDAAPAVMAAPVPAGARLLHEDDWRQIEFVSSKNYDHIQKQLEKLAAFKREHQRGIGWTSVYVRKEHATPLAAVGLQFASMPVLPASAVALSGHLVRDGFALSSGGEWFIYGQRTGEGGILHLSVSQAHSACPKEIAQVLVQIAQTGQLLLVDWYAGAVVDTSSADSVLGWSRRYSSQTP